MRPRSRAARRQAMVPPSQGPLRLDRYPGHAVVANEGETMDCSQRHRHGGPSGDAEVLNAMSRPWRRWRHGAPSHIRQFNGRCTAAAHTGLAQQRVSAAFRSGFRQDPDIPARPAADTSCGPTASSSARREPRLQGSRCGHSMGATAGERARLGTVQRPVLFAAGDTSEGTPPRGPHPGQLPRSSSAEWTLVRVERYHPVDTHLADTRRHDGESCPSCAKHSPRLYAEGWACLVPECTQFWILSTAVGLVPIPPSMKLSYDESFLRVAPTPFEAASLPYDIVPPLPSSAPETAGIEEAGSRSLWRGESATPSVQS